MSIYRSSTTRVVGALALSLVAASGLSYGSFGASSSSSSSVTDEDVSALAMSTKQAPQAVEHALGVGELGTPFDPWAHMFSTKKVNQPGVQHETNALAATVEVDGGQSTSTAVGVTYVTPGTPSVLLETAATAQTTNCAGCGASAVGVQVVVLRTPAALTTNSNAYASNVLCDDCITGAANFVIVLEQPRGKLSKSHIRQLEQFAKDRAAELAAGPQMAARGLQAPEDAALDELEALTVGWLGSGTVVTDREVDVDHG